MKPGDLIRFRVSHDGPKHLGILLELIDTQLVSGRMCYAKVFVPHNGRYSRGIILASPSHHGLITVVWHDGKINSEIITNINQYYTIIPQ